MIIERRGFLAGGALATLAACARLPGPVLAPAPPRLVPLRFDPARLMKTTVCLRPFRAAGPRLEAERFASKTVVHNYGHGGSGWSLSWGCAQEAADLARSGGANRFAVIGAGVIGMTTALKLLETGAQVTVYAEAFTPETRSARATGVWSPSSRIGLADAVDAGFTARWQRWAAASYAIHLEHVGLAGDPVEFIPQYNVASGRARGGDPPARRWLHLGRTLDVAMPGWDFVEGAANPFPGRTVRSGPTMVFNISEYAERLAQGVLLRGGRMVRRAFPDRAAVLALDEAVIVNCMGYGARTIWGDAALVPVRGQIGWLLPQPEARYAVWHDGIHAVSRRDGVVVQYLGPNDDWGYDDGSEVTDPGETERALATMRGLFA